MNILSQKSYKAFAILLAVIIPIPAFAEVNIAQMLENIEQQIPALTALLTGFCYVGGFFMILSALFQLRKYGEMRTMMAGSAELKGPIIHIIIGACIVQLPVVLQIMTETTFGTKNPLAYEASGDTSWDELASTIIIIVQFVGAIAMARGLFLLNKLGGGQAQPGTFSKAIIHIIGGTLCFNAYATAQILFTTLGIFG